MSINQPFRDSAKELQLWVTQLRSETDLCISEILDAEESPTKPVEPETQSKASSSVDRIAKRIFDVMSAYDSMAETIGEEPVFDDCIKTARDVFDAASDD